jgi:hypothetical protein
MMGALHCAADRFHDVQGSNKNLASEERYGGTDIRQSLHKSR